MSSEKSGFEKKMNSISGYSIIIFVWSYTILAMTVLNLIWWRPERAENADATMLALLDTQRQILMITGFGLTALLLAAGYALKCLALTGMNNVKRPETLEN
tara:strand:- start:454 stop:756 length:303 start_codon:yes stop_codon:yes gene_type:complete